MTKEQARRKCYAILRLRLALNGGDPADIEKASEFLGALLDEEKLARTLE